MIRIHSQKIINSKKCVNFLYIKYEKIIIDYFSNYIIISCDTCDGVIYQIREKKMLVMEFVNIKHNL